MSGVSSPVARSVARPVASSVAGSASGGGGGGLPSGAIGVWYAADYTAAGVRPYIPNRIATATAPKNLLNGTNRLFNVPTFWPSKNQVTVTDAQADRNGDLNAARVLSSGTSWYLLRTVSALPAGNYTIASWVKRNTGTDQLFKFYGGGSEQTATDTWQRFSYTFAHGGGTTLRGIQASSATNADILVSDMELFAGSSDLGEETYVGNMYFDVDATNAKHTYSGGIVSLAAVGSFGFVQFEDAISSDQISVVALVRKVSTSKDYVSSISKVQSATEFTARIENNGIPGFAIGTEFLPTLVQRKEGWDLTSRGWFTFAHVASGNSRSIWFDQIKLDTATNAVAPTTLRDLFVGTISNNTYGEGHELVALAMWDRALSDAETLSAQQALLAQTAVTRGQVRMLIVAGDSLSGGVNGYPALYLANDSPTVLLAQYSINGGTLEDVTPLILDKIPASKVAGSKYIFSIMVTNAVVFDTAVYLDLLSSTIDAMRARGAIVAVGTLPPRADPSFNIFRNIVNTEIRTWLGGRADGIFDFAADPTVGTDAAGSNATYYPDGTHPTAAVQSTYFEPIYRACINAL